MNKLTGIFVAGLLAALAACSPSGDPADSGADAPLQEMGSPTDNYGIYSGTVGGRPGFLVTREYPGELATITISLGQEGGAVRGFSGGAIAVREPSFEFKKGARGGDGQYFENGRYNGDRRGAAYIRGVWELNKSFVGRVTRMKGEESILDFDLTFNPITLSTYPEGDAMPKGRYDIFNDDQDIGDYIVETAGAATGTITWPGAKKACTLTSSPALRAMGTTRNVWHVEFNTADFTCAPPTWSIGYASRTNGRLTYDLIAVRQGNFAPAPDGEGDFFQLQLRRR